MGHAILVVDDDPAIRTLVVAILGAEGYNVTAVTTGESALCMVTAQRPHLLILDVHLPDMDGPTLYSQMKGLPGMDTLPVLWVTAYTGIVDGLPYNDPRMIVMMKPFSVDKLVSTVADVLS